MKIRNMASISLIDGEKILMLYKEKSRLFSDPMWLASAGGHFEEWEMCEPEKCLYREVEEETGLAAKDLCEVRLRYITTTHREGEIRHNYHYFGRLAPHIDPAEVTNNEGTLKWLDFCEIEALQMPESAKQCVLHYGREGRLDAALYALSGGFFGGEFRCNITKIN